MANEFSVDHVQLRYHQAYTVMMSLFEIYRQIFYIVLRVAPQSVARYLFSIVEFLMVRNHFASELS